MAKNLSPSELRDQLIALGMPVPKALEEKAANEKNDAVETYLYDRLSSIKNENDRIAAASDAREFFDRVAAEMLSFDSQEKNRQGRGDSKYVSHHLNIETSSGLLKIDLQR